MEVYAWDCAVHTTRTVLGPYKICEKKALIKKALMPPWPMWTVLGFCLQSIYFSPSKHPDFNGGISLVPNTHNWLESVLPSCLIPCPTQPQVTQTRPSSLWSLVLESKTQECKTCGTPTLRCYTLIRLELSSYLFTPAVLASPASAPAPVRGYSPARVPSSCCHCWLPKASGKAPSTEVSLSPFPAH